MGKTVAQARTQAQLRGKQIMDAMRATWPGVRILSTYGAWLSETLTYTTLNNAGINYNDVAWANELQGSFVVGLIESAAGTSATVIDGGEVYTLRSEADFQVMKDWEKTGFPAQSALVPSTLKATYANNLSASFGIYDTPWQGETMDLAIWEPTITNGMRKADRYVWAYVEQYDWLGGGWPTTPVPQSWKDATARARAAVAAPATSYYGSALNGDGIGNLVVGTSSGDQATQTFMAGKSGTVVALRTWLKNMGTVRPGYGLGDGGALQFTMQTDNNGIPSGTILGTGVAYPGAADAQGINPGRFTEWTFDAQPTITAGTQYHLVWRNIHADPVNNYASVNYMYMATVLNPRQPLVSWGNTFHSLRKSTSTGNAWIPAYGYSHHPQIDFRFSDGSHWGQGYMNTSLAYSSDYHIISTTTMVRERFTVSGGNKVVTGAAVRIAKTSGTGPLTVRLESSTGVLIDSFNVSTTGVPTLADGVDMVSGGVWVSGSFASPRTLVNGTEYRLRLSTDASTNLWTRGLQQGTGYGFNSATYFADGVLEVTSNSGSTWGYTPLNTYGDMQFYFTTTSDRSTLVPGTYIPGLTANTVGVMPGTTFIDVFPDSGTEITSTALPPGTYNSYRFWGNIRRTSGTDAYTFINCVFAGHDPSLTPTGTYDGMAVNYSTGQWSFTDCTFDGWAWNTRDGSVHHVYRSVYGDYVDLKGYVNSIGFKGGRATFTRCEFVNLQDGFQIQRDNTTITQCAIWECQYTSGDPSFGSGNYTHNDGVQWMAGTNGVVSYNMIGGRRILDGYTANPASNVGEDCYNAGVFLKNETGAAFGVNVHHNWVGGGAASIHGVMANSDYLTGVTIANNKVLRRPATVAVNGYRNDDVPATDSYILKNTTTMTIAGNVIWDLNGSIDGTGVPAPIE